MAKEDLIPVRSKEEAKKRGKVGGKKSGESRRRRKALREHLEALLSSRREGLTTAEALTIALVEKGLSGDVRAYEVIRDTIGEKPVDKAQSDNTTKLIIEWGE